MAAGARLNLTPGEVIFLDHLLSAHLADDLWGYEQDMLQLVHRPIQRFIRGLGLQRQVPHGSSQAALFDLDEPSSA